MQKAVFLIVERGGPRWRDAYRYRPYDWGPYSGALVEDVNDLIHESLLKVEPAPGNRYGNYMTTSA